MWNWDIGNWRDLARSCYSLVSELWFRQTDSLFNDLLSNFSVTSKCPVYFPLDLLPSHSISLVPDMALASVLLFGSTYSEGFLWHFLSCFCLGLNASGGFSSRWSGEGPLLHLWAFTTMLPLCLLPPSPWFVQLLPSVRDCAWHTTAL